MHIWVRAEVRDFEKRVGITPEAVAKLIAEKTFEMQSINWLWE